MVSEVRQIIFSNGELIRAIIAFDRSNHKRLPRHRVVECKLDSEPTVATLVFDTAWKEDKFVHLSEDALIAVLIHACAANGIPLPKSAIKSLRPMGDDLALNFSVNTRSAESDYEEKSLRWGNDEAPAQPH